MQLYSAKGPFKIQLATKFDYVLKMDRENVTIEIDELSFKGIDP